MSYDERYEGIEDAAYFYENQCESDIEKMKSLLEDFIKDKNARIKKLEEIDCLIKKLENGAFNTISRNQENSYECSDFLQFIIIARVAINMASKACFNKMNEKNIQFKDHPLLSEFKRGCELLQHILNDNFYNEFLIDLQGILDDESLQAIKEYYGENFELEFTERVKKTKDEN